MAFLPFGIDIFSFVPAIGAIALSIKNWWVLHKGAVIEASDIVNYGIWSTKKDGSQNKTLFLPILLSNDGSRAGMVRNIRIRFSTLDKTGELEIRRKVKMENLSGSAIRGMSIGEFTNKGVEEINPFYPINVNSKEDTSFIIECFDGKNVIPLNQELNCSIEVEYGRRRSSTHSFPFFLSEDNFNKSLDYIHWLRSTY